MEIQIDHKIYLKTAPNTIIKIELRWIAENGFHQVYTSCINSELKKNAANNQQLFWLHTDNIKN